MQKPTSEGKVQVGTKTKGCFHHDTLFFLIIH